jgi:predicted dinucleotide-binding enzyme
MRIGVIGAGRMGHAIAAHMARAGHEVAMANSRGPETLQDVAADIGARAATVEDAIRVAELVFLAIPYNVVDRTAAAGSWDGKLVVDLTNYYEGRDGPELDPGDESSSVLVAEKLPGARVVKAFNTILWKRLESEPGLVIFYATDDDAAGDTVAELIREAGFVPVKTGGLRDGGLRQQPGSDIYDVPMNEDEARAILRP